MRIALLTNIPAPYRVPIYDRLAKEWGDDFHVFYLAQRESHRKWNPPRLQHSHTYLPGAEIMRRGQVAHINLGAFRALKTFAPDVVLTCGFNPAMVCAWLYARAAGIAHVAVSDSWLFKERDLSALHRLVRKLVLSTSHACVGASEKTLDLFRSYGVRRNLFVAPLCIDNSAFSRHVDAASARPYDLVFAGRFIPGKLPLFFADVARRVAQRRPRVTVLVIGEGELRTAMERELQGAPNIEATFTGFLQQDELPAAYAQGKVFLFPTQLDAWGVVANEASAAGLPVLTCDRAGCANELVRHGVSGYVLPLDAEMWAVHADGLLSDHALWVQMSNGARDAVASYTFDAAANAFMAALRACTRP